MFMEGSSNIDNRITHPACAEVMKIKSTDFWVKVVGFLQHNWAIIEEAEKNQFKIFFFDDLARVFDELEYKLLDDATEALNRNGFSLWEEEDDRFKEHIPKPNLPFSSDKHPNGLIYSSGRFWQE